MTALDSKQLLLILFVLLVDRTENIFKLLGCPIVPFEIMVAFLKVKKLGSLFIRNDFQVYVFPLELRLHSLFVCFLNQWSP